MTVGKREDMEMMGIRDKNITQMWYTRCRSLKRKEKSGLFNRTMYIGHNTVQAIFCAYPVREKNTFTAVISKKYWICQRLLENGMGLKQMTWRWLEMLAI